MFYQRNKTKTRRLTLKTGPEEQDEAWKSDGVFSATFFSNPQKAQTDKDSGHTGG